MLGECRDDLLDETESPAQPEYKVERPLVLFSEFLEVFAGTAILTGQAVAHGLHCGPPIKLEDSIWWDLRDMRVVEWLV